MRFDKVGNWFLYHPNALHKKRALPPNARVFDIPVGDDTSLSACCFPAHGARQPKARVVLWHGNAGDLRSHYTNFIWLTHLGYEFTLFDYRGYGKSKGKPTPEQNTRDSLQVLHWLDQQSSSPLILIGQSMGGAVLLGIYDALVQFCALRLLVLDSTFLSFTAIAQNYLESTLLPRSLSSALVQCAFSDAFAGAGNTFAQAPCPALVCHSLLDHIVPHKFGKRVFQALPGQKQWWEDSKPGHCRSFSRPEFQLRLWKKIESSLDP